MSTNAMNFWSVFIGVSVLFFFVLLIANTIKENVEIKESCEKTEMVVIADGKTKSIYDCSGVGR